MKAELRSLPRTLADLVAQHLVASGRFLDDDPELAYQHARTARRLAARLGGVREAVAITAYLAEHFDEALTEFRAVRRMTGNHEVLAMMADCERALGRPDKALALSKDKHVHDLSEPTQIELLIVAAGARRDMGQNAAAVQMLDVPELTKRTRADWLPRLRYAYADALAAVGRTDDALVWFHRAAGADGEGTTGAAERAAELEGLEFTDLDEDDTVLDDEYFEDEDTDSTDAAADADAADAEVDGADDDVDDAGADGVDDLGDDADEDLGDDADEDLGGGVHEDLGDDVDEDLGDGVDEDLGDGVDEDLGDGVHEDLDGGVHEDLGGGVDEDLGDGVDGGVELDGSAGGSVGAGDADDEVASGVEGESKGSEE